MISINLKKIISRKELQDVISQLMEDIDSSICIQQADGQTLIGSVSESKQGSCRYPIKLADQSIGWVIGNEKSAIMASLISYVAKQEYEKKALARELLEKYKEIDLLQDLSARINTSLDLQEISQFVIEEAVDLLESTNGSICLFNSQTNSFSILGEVGTVCCLQQSLIKFRKSIIDNILKSGEGEIINDITSNPKLRVCDCLVNSIIYVPLKTKEKIIGAIAVGSESGINYRTEHLKILTLLASQAATAIEKALLYQRSCDEAEAAQEQAQKLEQALKQLQQAQAQLVQSEKMSSLGKMVAGIAHEINNPVNFIHGNLNYLNQYIQDLLYLLSLYQKNYSKPVAEIEKTIEEIELDFLLADLPQLLSSMKIGTDRIKEIVVSLRNFSHLDQAEKKSVDLHEGINNTLLILNHRLKATKNQNAIQTIKEYGDLPNIECYAGQLNQVFMNILSNAIEAMIEFNQPPKTATIRISTQVVDSDWVTVCIADNGPGIPEEILHKIYDPFFTTKPIGKGTGLGMAISHQIIVEKHGGLLKCVSKPGEGTEFLIQIPINVSRVNQFKKVINLEHNHLITLPIKYL